MKFLCFLFFSMISLSLLADEVKIEINPPKPVVGEVFRAYVRIFTDADDEPTINFVPSSIEVVGKSNQGVSTRTVYANGNLTVTREMTYVYELVASKAGSAALRDINIQLGGKNLRHPTVSFTVLSEPEQKSDIYLVADVPKKEVFVGEGIVVRYYLYSKNTTQVKAIETKKFPKLNSFLKRYLQEPENPERVSVDGEVYIRRLVYAAKLFAEKPGELKIDSLQAAVVFAQLTSSDPFSAFGFSRDFRNRSLSSETVKLTVRSLPEPVPAHFTGLIGKHDFDLTFNQNKLIVNEPLEVKLSVTGGGMLEGMDAPKLIQNPGFEEFETNGDLKITDANNATKTFDYTYLAKNNLTVPASSVTLSYFDPISFKYVPTVLPIPELVVAGGQTKNSQENSTPEAQTPKDDNKNLNLPKVPVDFSGPMLTDALRYKLYLPYINFAFALAALLLALSWFIKTDRFPKWGKAYDIPRQFKQGEFSFGEFARWISPLIQKTGKAPVAIILDSDLDDSAKRYFIDLLKTNDYKDYSATKVAAPFEYKSAYFKSLSKYIESARDESSSAST